MIRIRAPPDAASKRQHSPDRVPHLAPTLRSHFHLGFSGHLFDELRPQVIKLQFRFAAVDLAELIPAFLHRGRRDRRR